MCIITMPDFWTVLSERLALDSTKHVEGDGGFTAYEACEKIFAVMENDLSCTSTIDGPPGTADARRIWSVMAKATAFKGSQKARVLFRLIDELKQVDDDVSKVTLEEVLGYLEDVRLSCRVPL